MIEQAQTYAERENLGNVSFMVRDFRKLDIADEKLSEKFDLVFASNTPALQGIEELEKAIALSRKYCMSITQIHSHNQLESRIMREVFGRNHCQGPSGQWFYAAFNLLFLMGYYPQTSYYKRHSVCSVSPDLDYARILMERALSPDECTPKSEKLILEWLQAHTDQNSRVSEVRNICYGRLLWDVREKTARQSYPFPELANDK